MALFPNQRPLRSGFLLLMVSAIVLRMISLLVVLSLILTACTPSAQVTPGPGEGTPPAGTPAAPGTTPSLEASPASPGVESPTSPDASPLARIRIRSPNVVPSLDPLFTDGFGLYPTGLVGGLLQRPLRDGTLKNDLAETAEISADGLTYTYVLKEGVVYSDGSAVTSEDAMYSIERQIAERGGQVAQLEPYIDSMTTPDDRTLIIRLKQPFGLFREVLATSFLAVHPKSRMIADPNYFNQPVSAGPYVVSNWVPNGLSMTLTENPTYVGGPLMIKEIELASIADPQSTVLQLATGALDWATDLPFANATGVAPDVELRVANPLGSFHVGFNVTQPGPVGNRLVRQAISLALDRDQISQVAWFGQLPPADSFIYRVAPEYEPGVLLNEGKQDVDGAKALLAETDWPDGFDLNLITIGPRDGHVATATVIAQQLLAIGINVTVEPLEPATYSDRVTAGSYEAVWQGSAGYPGAAQMVNNYCPEQSWGLLTRYDNPEACALARSALAAPDVDAAKADLRLLYEIANRDMSLAPTNDRGSLVGTRIDWDLFGYPETGFYAVWVVPTVEEWASR